MLHLADYERFASRTLPKDNWDYFSAGNENNVTLKDNMAAFKRYKLIPRVLRDVSSPDTRTTVLGHEISFPVCIAPSATHRRAHAAGEVSTAQGAAAVGTLFALSSYSSLPLEAVAEGAPGSPKLLQIFIFHKRDLVLELVRRAERARYSGLLVTVDSPTANPRAGGSWQRGRDTLAKQVGVM